MKFKKLFLIFSLACVMFLCCCSSPYEFSRNSFINITVADGEQYYLRKNSYTIERGDDLTVTVIYRNGYIPDGCSYENYEIIKIAPGEYSLTLRRLNYPEFVKLGETNGNEAIRYYANGGEYIDIKPVEGYINGEISKTHLRTNTDLGFGIKRKGYIQTGWNTRADGTGEHTGLGSRVTTNQEGTTELFAEWVQETEIDRFEYETLNGGIYLTAYTGEKHIDKLALPSAIDGFAVLGVKQNFCEGVTAHSLVIPKTVKVVERGAFTNCSFESFYFFDSLSDVCDESFFSCDMGTVFINAASYPRYQSDTEIAYFSDAIDRLFTLKDKKKILFFSGCSFAYGLDSEMIAKEAGSLFQVLNLGVIGGTNAGFQLDIISHFVGKGDVLVHAPEPASPYQLMSSNSAELRMFVVTEGNYDLLSLVDIAAIDGFFTNFAKYCKNRAQLEPGSYEGFCDMYNVYGDIIKPRPFVGEDRPFTDDFSYSFEPEFVNAQSAERLCGYYDKLRVKGVKIVVSFSPVNYHGMPPEDRQSRCWENYELNLNRFLSGESGIEIISRVTDYIFEGRYFYDTDYHLNDVGVKVRTERLLKDLKTHGVFGEGV